MEKLSLKIFNEAELPQSKLKRVVGGAPTAGGTKTVNNGTSTSATIGWGSDDGNGTLYSSYRKNDDGTYAWDRRQA
jgi:hypothetical protein